MMVKDSPIHGKGLFADRDYAQNGFVLSFSETHHLGFVNHSCVPSCYVKYDISGNYGLNKIFAKRKIARGTEITVDYRIGQTFPQWLKFINGKCACKKCISQ